MRHAKVIELLGGYKEVAKEMDLNHTTVFKWMKSGIPADRFPEIVAMARRKNVEGITLESLHSARR